ncbi:MAG: Na(+)-translocating NADH-quinone reductase subunit A [Bacteroidetes bacterium]|nr:MAG: Na(+)-translocating NADH-quinone reductase subunit A [Bacteroidota bacterium]
MSKAIKIKQGLDIPMQGEAEKILNTSPRSAKYSVCPPDFHGLTPKMLVKEGEKVKAGTPLFFDKYNEKIIFTSPVSGTFSDLVRGEKRRILRVTIDADATDEYVEFGEADPLTLEREEVAEKILQSGLWPAIRQRPYAVVANPADKPKAIFISAFDSAPLAADLDFILNGQEREFQTGLNALSKLTDGDVHLSVHAKTTLNKGFLNAKNVKIHQFEGPHPAGLVGIQIHHIDPVDKGDVVWYAGIQHVIMIGRLFEKGIYDASEIIALAGSEILNPRYYRVINGAKVLDIAQKNIRREPDVRLRFISGDVLTGCKVNENGFLRFYDNQITVIPEGDKPEVLGWMLPNFDKFSISRSFPAFLMPGKKFRLNTNIRSGERPFVITGLYEKVLPMNIMPMQLLKSIMINDIDMMEKLGIYEVAPEDFALCEYVCPSKIEIQDTIREGLDVIRKEFS